MFIFVPDSKNVSDLSLSQMFTIAFGLNRMLKLEAVFNTFEYEI